MAAQDDAAQKRDRRADAPPPTFHYGRGRITQLQLQPGGRFVTFTVEEEPPALARTTVLNYVTESGYAETETARPKVGTPGGDRFYFQSEETEFSHLYALDVATGERTQLTSGDFEVSSPVLSKNGDTWYFLSTEQSPHERHVYRMPAANAPA